MYFNLAIKLKIRLIFHLNQLIYKFIFKFRKLYCIDLKFIRISKYSLKKIRKNVILIL